MSFLSYSISSSSQSSSSSTSPLWSRRVFPTYLPTFAAHSLYAAILTNPVILHAVEDLPLFHEDLICQELVCLFHDVLAAQHYHALSTPHDLPVDFGIPLGMSLASLPDRILSILHLHGFHTFIEQIPPAIIYPTFRCIFLTMTMEQCDHYISQSELPPHWSPSPLPIPAPNSPTSSLLAQLSSPAPSDTSSSLTTIDPEYGLDEDAVSVNRYFIMQLGNNRPVISASTCLLNVPIACHPASTLTECFWCSGTGHYHEDCPLYVCPHCHLSAPRHPQTACLSTQCDLCSQWGHSNRFCPTRTCNLCDQGGHIIDNCPINVLSPEQASHILGIPLTLDRSSPHGVLIEPGVRLYKGGNATICLLTHGIFLLSFFHHTHILFGMCSDNWVHCLILLSSSDSSFIEL